MQSSHQTDNDNTNSISAWQTVSHYTNIVSSSMLKGLTLFLYIQSAMGRTLPLSNFKEMSKKEITDMNKVWWDLPNERLHSFEQDFDFYSNFNKEHFTEGSSITVVFPQEDHNNGEMHKKINEGVNIVSKNHKKGGKKNRSNAFFWEGIREGTPFDCNSICVKNDNNFDLIDANSKSDQCVYKYNNVNKNVNCVGFNGVTNDEADDNLIKKSNEMITVYRNHIEPTYNGIVQTMNAYGKLLTKGDVTSCKALCFKLCEDIKIFYKILDDTSRQFLSSSILPINYQNNFKKILEEINHLAEVIPLEKSSFIRLTSLLTTEGKQLNMLGNKFAEEVLKLQKSFQQINVKKNNQGLIRSLRSNDDSIRQCTLGSDHIAGLIDRKQKAHAVSQENAKELNDFLASQPTLVLYPKMK